MKLGVMALARPTFDVEFSQELADQASAVVLSLGEDVVGTSALCMDDESVQAAASAWQGQDIDALIIVQASFADSTLVATAASTTTAPLLLWAAPEPRTGGRLRRNSFCGINLAAYLLRRTNTRYGFVYIDPTSPESLPVVRGAIEHLISGQGAGDLPIKDRTQTPGPVAVAKAEEVVARLADTRVGIVGDRPTGFEPCDFDADQTKAALGVSIQQVELETLFAAGRAASDGSVVAATSFFENSLDLSPIGDASIEPSVRLHLGLREMAEERQWSGLATRCWPECFTEFGGAACSAQARLNSELGLPALCEADAYGVITSLILQWLGAGSSFVADLVDLDLDDGTAVVWHCGLAPVEMAAEPPRATIHSNRKLPLLNEFGLRPGRVTIARLSQSAGELRMVVGSGEMLDAPLPYSGTAGTMRFDTELGDVLDTIMAEGLEHHYGIVYADVAEELVAVAGALGIGTVRL